MTRSFTGTGSTLLVRLGLNDLDLAGNWTYRGTSTVDGDSYTLIEQGGALLGIDLFAQTTDALSLIGTASGETIAGTAGANTIDGLGGTDQLAGRGGNDIINGGAGADT